MSDEVYTHGHPEVVVTAHATRGVADSAEYLVAHLVEGTDLLDLGCGPGSVTVGLARLIAPGRVVGIDTAASVLDQAREFAQREGVDVDFQVANVYDLPFPDGSFDVVHAHQVLHHLGDPVAALGEARRVLRPGGLLAVRDADFSTFVLYPTDPPWSAGTAHTSRCTAPTEALPTRDDSCSDGSPPPT